MQPLKLLGYNRSWANLVLFHLHLYCFVTTLVPAYMAANLAMHNRSKHIEVDHHFIREMVARKQLVVRFVPSKDQLADIMTKGLHSPRYISLRTKLTVVSKPCSFEGGC